jgi:uncharacterized protein (UPF0332 family)
MLDEKTVKKEMEGLREEIRINAENKRFADFYLKQSLLTLNASKVLMQLSKDNASRKNFTFLDENFEANLWVINTAYYSMFYMANAMLAKQGIKIRTTIGVHKKTYVLLMHYFYMTKKLARHYIDTFEKLQNESQELMAMEKAKDLMEKYGSEMKKRAIFTYNVNEQLKQAKAETSINRAIEFYNEGLSIIEKTISNEKSAPLKRKYSSKPQQ